MKILTLLAVAAFAIAVAPAGAAGDRASASARTITVDDDFFSPSSTSVNKNTTVKWVWRGSSRHNVKVRSGPVKFRSSTKRSGSYSRRMGTRGTYKIYCSLHPSSMKMTLRVK